MTTIAAVTAQQPAFVAPTLGGARAELCPQAGFRRTAAHDQVLVPAAGMATGHRSWSPPIT